ncbi:hypothetical protein DCG74_04990 [Bradyrhizobium sp. WBAH42]|nr:hypothetical protein [Bradyrhizobium sp. WBAH30]MDD1544604.1 hypothetical protein [Bradyrhizobium sp. WBAH41]MDD1559367.1 hypothetical protein [Bradyrhizobium sp. WBAH23]MDD1566882.1 hypothetical protein [Bradyrhizobium sp. WBAH33]MDD1592900.1 hypothetical protein [Bradyrhizobium sp. WBAH42]NRB90288.1 hypothetical protein [Bradyrhizobium sp. WBAH10]QCJ88004.1 hypothetical protein DAA57_05330 [Bradyrhizobium yuanmingense]
MGGSSLCLLETPLSPRHCEEPLRRSNPDCLLHEILDYFAAFAMTEHDAVRGAPRLAAKAAR